MPSDVNICNAALTHIGDTANVSSINPPDGSAQAGYCAIFYPIALSAILEMASWNFSTTRAALAQVTNPSSTWLYAYAVPSNMVNAISVLCADALDDYSQNWAQQDPYLFPQPNYQNPADNFYAPQPYAMEVDSKGNQIILTNVPNAVLRFTIEASDPMQYTPLFVVALSYLLAHFLAGPIIKGEAGASKANDMLQKFQMWEAIAEASDASQRRIEPKQSVPWMAGR